MFLRILSAWVFPLLLLLLPIAAHGHGTNHELIAAATREIEANPNDGAPYLRRAFLHLEHGDWHACLLDVDEAERRQRVDLGAGLLRGQALKAGGQYAEALAVLDAFVAAHPEHAAALMERARVHGALGHNAEAAQDFARGVALLPRPEPDQVCELAASLCRAGREDDALAAIDALPAVPALVERALQIETKIGRFDAALRRIERAIAAATVKEPLMARRAALLAQAGRTRESIAAWRELSARVAAMPPEVRGSHAMSTLAEQTRHALAALTSLAP